MNPHADSLPDSYPEWQHFVEKLQSATGTALILGAADSGKTTFCTLLANAAIAAGRRIAIVDGDPGQSTIGPPTCAGLALPEFPFADPSRLTPVHLAFVGSTSPRGRLLEHAVAVWEMAYAAKEAGAELIIVDTTGFIRGAAARRLKEAKLRLLAPAHVVAIQRRGECEPILLPIEKAGSAAIHRLPVPAVITRKPPSYRAQRRAASFARYFAGAERRTVRLDDVATTGTWLNAGTSLQPHVLKFLSGSLGARIYYAEMTYRDLGLVVAAPPASEQGWSLVHEQLRPESISVTPVSRYRNLVVGLSGGRRLLGIGVIESIDFRRRTVTIATPVRASSVQMIRFGLLRVTTDGAEIQTLRPGDV